MGLRSRGLLFAERLGSGDGERRTLLTRQIAFEPLPASVLFGLGLDVDMLLWSHLLNGDATDLSALWQSGCLLPNLPEHAEVN